MASKRPRKPKSSPKTGSRSARSSRARVVVKRTTAAKKAAPKRSARTGSARATAKRTAPEKPLAPPKPARSPSLPRGELLAQAKAAGIPGRHRMTVAQLRAALARLADQPAAAAPSSDGGLRLSAGATPPPSVAGLPWRYGVTELVAMPADPLLVHVYWELSAEAVARGRAQLGPSWDGSSQVLRGYDVADGPAHNGNEEGLAGRARHHFDFDIGGEVGNYYIHLWSPEQTLVFEIGWRAQDGRFVAATRSNRVTTPRNAPHEGGPERWMTVRNGRIMTTSHNPMPGEAMDIKGTPGPAPWSGTFPAHRGWGGRQ